MIWNYWHAFVDGAASLAEDALRRGYFRSSLAVKFEYVLCLVLFAHDEIIHNARVSVLFTELSGMLEWRNSTVREAVDLYLWNEWLHRLTHPACGLCAAGYETASQQNKETIHMERKPIKNIQFYRLVYARTKLDAEHLDLIRSTQSKY